MLSMGMGKCMQSFQRDGLNINFTNIFNCLYMSTYTMSIHYLCALLVQLSIAECRIKQTLEGIFAQQLIRNTKQVGELGL